MTPQMIEVSFGPCNFCVWVLESLKTPHVPRCNLQEIYCNRCELIICIHLYFYGPLGSLKAADPISQLGFPDVIGLHHARLYVKIEWTSSCQSLCHGTLYPAMLAPN